MGGFIICFAFARSDQKRPREDHPSCVTCHQEALNTSLSLFPQLQKMAWEIVKHFLSDLFWCKEAKISNAL